MEYILGNFASSKLVSSLSAIDTQLAITGGDGAKFPSLPVGKYFMLVLEDASGNREICRCTAVAGDLFTIVRGQEGTVARTFAVGDRVAIRFTAGAFDTKADKDTVTTQLALKADASALALKADASALALKADASALALKADVSALTAKADLAGSTFTGAVNLSSGSIAADATATALWAPANGNVQIWAGTPTITDFPDAPAAGATRLVFPTSGTTITSAGRITVQGGTRVAGANECWQITAKTTTSFYVSVSAYTAPFALDEKLDLFSKLPENMPYEAHYAQYAALTSANTVLSWGRADNSALGTSQTEGVANAPAEAQFYPSIPTGVTVTKLIRGQSAIYAVLSNGWVYSGGTNTYGQLGHGDTTARPALTRIEFFVTNSLSVQSVYISGDRFAHDRVSAIFVTSTGVMYGCGYNAYGQLGIGNTIASITTPTIAAGAISGVTKVVMCEGKFLASAYALTTSGALYATGGNVYGELGTGNTTNLSAFTQVIASGVADVAHSGGLATASPTVTSQYGGHTLIRKADGTVWAAGLNVYGQLGVGDTSLRNVFTQIPGLTNIQSIGAAGGYYGFSWAVNNLGKLYLWGYNVDGVCGNGSTTNVLAPQVLSTWSGNVAQEPPFHGKILKVVGGSAGVGTGGLFVIDTDGGVYFAGQDTSGAFSSTYVVGAITRFAPIRLPNISAYGKVVDVRSVGLDGAVRVYLLTSGGYLFASGDNAYGAVTGAEGATAIVRGFRRIRI